MTAFDPEQVTTFLAFGGVFVAVYVLNVIPAFAPPTWMALSYIGMANSSLDSAALAVVGAVAATAGRVTLAKLARVIVRGRLLGQDARENVDSIRAGIERRPVLSFAGILFYAFSPLPSNYLFIAYGLTSLRIALAAAPFFVGRVVSYSFWIFSAAAVGRKYDLDFDDGASVAGLYFLLSQLFLVPVLYVFVKLDWREMIATGAFRWRRKRAQ